MSKKIGARILAAGYSSRMGAFKATLQLGKRKVIEHVIGVCRDAGISDIGVITGYNREELASYLQGIREIYNPDFSQGMFSSIQKAAESAKGLDGFFIMPVDCPLIDESVLQEMKNQFLLEKDDFFVPCYKGKKGHPLLVPAFYYQEILDHDGVGGLKTITDRDYDKMKRIDVGCEGVLLDMDDAAGYEEIKAHLSRGCKSEDLLELAAGRRFFLIRHGQIEQHREKIFLGQTDVPLSTLGRQQAAEAAGRLRAYHLDTAQVYASDLKRAEETAQAIGFLDTVALSGLREMALGPWDGKYISDIQKLYPDEFKKRGDNLLVYKMGHGSENFFDLQYRVEKTLIGLLKKDKSRDIVIVAHSGVLRCICNNLQGKDVAAPWEKMENGGLRVIEPKQI